MVSVNDLTFNDVNLRIFVDYDKSYGWSADVSEAVMGSSTDRSGKTFGELMNNVFSWSGIGGFDFDVDVTFDEVRSVIHRLNTEANELGIEFVVRIYINLEAL